jgi:hypothetical protein
MLLGLARKRFPPPKRCFPTPSRRRETIVLSVHAEGASLRLQGRRRRQAGWAFREPIATLLADGKTVGRPMPDRTGNTVMAVR